ncbi:MAG: hypothetical protein ACO1SV_27630 [Fimbriimonas sp.]
MLNHILSPAAIARVRTEIPDARLLPYGGPWGARVPDVPATHDELTEYDRNIPPAADLIAYGADVRDVEEKPTEVVQDKAIRIKSASKLTQTDMQTLLRVIEAGGAVDSDRQSLLGIARRHMERRLQSVAITRGILLAGMACGELSWAANGVITGTMDFGMPASMKVTPAEYWMNADGSPNADATPITDMAALDRAAEALGGSPFDSVDMSDAMYRAMLASDEYHEQALAVAVLFHVSSLPIAGTGAAMQLAERVIGRKITIVDSVYETELLNGTRISGRYVPEKYVVLYRAADVGNSVAWDFANVHLTESAIAKIGNNTTFGNQVIRGPFNYIVCDDKNFSWVRMLGTQEGTPRRHSRTATARILAKEPA